MLLYLPYVCLKDVRLLVVGAFDSPVRILFVVIFLAIKKKERTKLDYLDKNDRIYGSFFI